MRRYLAVLVTLSNLGLSAALGAAAQPRVVSGRAVGEITPSFAVLDVTGPYKGKPICYVCEYQDAPTIIAFFQDFGEEMAGLVVKLNELAQKKKKLKMVAAVIAGPDRKPGLEKFAQENGITIPLVVFRKGKHDVAMKLYKLNAEARNTILVNVNRKVSANLTNVGVQNFNLIAEAASKVMGERQH
jgi:hypothetical protein